MKIPATLRSSLNCRTVLRLLISPWTYLSGGNLKSGNWIAISGPGKAISYGQSGLLCTGLQVAHLAAALRIVAGKQGWSCSVPGLLARVTLSVTCPEQERSTMPFQGFVSAGLEKKCGWRQVWTGQSTPPFRLFPSPTGCWMG